MKRLIITIFAIVVVFTLSSASVSAQGVTGGLKAGVNIANIHGDNVEDVWDSKIGICAGGFITCNLSDLFAIQPELMISQKGAKDESEMELTFWGVTTKTTTDIKYNLTYLEIPVLAKLMLPIGELEANVFAGPALALKLSSKMKGTVKVEVTGEPTEELDFDEKIEDLKSTDFGLVLGGSVGGFEVGPGKVMVDVRLTLGLSNWGTKTTDIITGEEKDASIKNGAISIVAGYSF